MSQEIIDVPVESSETPKTMPVVIIGSGESVLAPHAAFRVPVGTTRTIHPMSELDLVIESQPGLVFFTDQLAVKKNDTLDDTDLINACQKLIKLTQAGIVIRSTLNIESTERLIMALSKQVFDAKIVYMPDSMHSTDVGQLISPEIQYLGGTPETIQSLMSLLTNLSHFSAGELKTGTVFEVVYANLAVAGARLVKQSFFDEFHQSVLDLRNANPMIVRRMIERHPSMVDPTVAIPISVTDRDEFVSTIFNGATDKLTVLDAALKAQRVLQGKS